MQLYLHMVRKFWLNKIKEKWQEKSVIWLTGVRRTGKTTLCKSIDKVSYFDCELPRVRNLLKDPEDFFQRLDAKIIALDEIHRLDNASEVLKIGADHFPQIKIIATGSSSLSAGKKFKDTLTDRKRTILMTPLSLEDLSDFKKEDLLFRMQRGGLPPFFLDKSFPESSFQEWLDSFWAKDIEELFNIEKKSAFLKFFELLALQSGGIFEAKSFASPCGVSHTTIASYLRVLEETHIAYVLRPFHSNQSKEIISAPKVYFFDTGFINFFKGTDKINDELKGFFFEHLVLNQLLTQISKENFHYWRDKSKNEIDLVLKLRGRDPIALECKWTSTSFESKALRKFREIHKNGINLIVCQDATKVIHKQFDGIKVDIVPIAQLMRYLQNKEII